MLQATGGKQRANRMLWYSAVGLAILLLTLAFGRLVSAHSASEGARPAGQQASDAPLLTPTPSSTATPACGLAWRMVEDPNPGSGGIMFGVSALSSNDVWAVGWYTATGVQHTLVQRWTGSQWNTIPSPNSGQYDNRLYAVTALSPTNVWAVGSYEYNDVNFVRPLIEHWDGTQWAIVDTDRSLGNLNAIAAFSANDIWAVGDDSYLLDTAGSYNPMILHWDGLTWNFVTTPFVQSAGTLEAVTVVAANDAWAVGADAENGSFVPFMEHWDGTQWSILPNPAPSVTNGSLWGITKISANDIWAVGRQFSVTLTLHWNGTQWSIVPSPSPSTASSFYGVTGVLTNDVWAVGTTFTGSTATETTLTEHWNGTQWAVVESPGTDTTINELRHTAAVSAGDVWAVGFSNTYQAPQTLVERYNDPCAAGTPTATATGTVGATATATDTAVATRTNTATATVTQASTLTPTQTNTALPTNTRAATTTSTPANTSTATPCAVAFTDVHPTDYFYIPVQYLTCHGAISGYSDNTFRPFNDTTRGQLTKIVVLAEGFTINTAGGPHFTDVQTSNPFYVFIETAYNMGLVSGYADGTFRWGANVTRAQLSKIIVVAEGWAINTSGGPHFNDVPASSAFYGYVETAYNRGIISGYSDLTFRPNNNATRGQIAKIVYAALQIP